MNIVQYNNKLQAIDLNKEIVAILRDNTDAMADLNREQLQEGKRDDNSMIDPPYAKLTIEIKKQKGQPWDHVYLRDTGDFWARIRYFITGKRIYALDSDEKTKKLLDKYDDGSASVLGLTKENKGFFTKDIFAPALYARLRKLLS